MTEPPEWPKGFDHSDFSDEAMAAREKYFRARRAWNKTQERNYPHPGLDAPWPFPDPPARVWEAAPGILGAFIAAPMLSFNGYVLLPPGHPWRHSDMQRIDEDDPRVVHPEVHGGITFGPHITGWIGFDTAHAWDHWEWSYLDTAHDLGFVSESIWERWLNFRQLAVTMHHHDDHCHHWTLEDLEREVEDLALQAHLLDERTAHGVSEGSVRDVEEGATERPES